MLVILDTNILLSALLSPSGTPALLLDAWGRREFTLVSSGELLGELREVAGRPFFLSRLSPGTVESLLADLEQFSLFCRRPPSGPIAPDPKDSYLLALAEATTADFLATGDKQLLSVKRHKSTRIVTGTALLGILSQQWL